RPLSASPSALAVQEGLRLSKGELPSDRARIGPGDIAAALSRSDPAGPGSGRWGAPGPGATTQEMSGSRAGLSYCHSARKRAFDLSVAVVLLTLLAPILVILALLVLVTSGPPILFRQERIGLGSRRFTLLKFRTMRPGSDRSMLLAARGDGRVTAVGRFLRVSKLDELPQLINVIRVEMSIVGPRPEVPRYVAGYDARQIEVLEVRPGLTDPASVLFRDEE